MRIATTYADRSVGPSHTGPAAPTSAVGSRRGPAPYAGERFESTLAVMLLRDRAVGLGSILMMFSCLIVSVSNWNDVCARGLL